jgi:DNA-binding CsgD family transcriptional regulator
VLKFVVKGYSSTEIAGRFGNKTSTIQTHRKNIKRKLNLSGHRALIKWSREYFGEIDQYPIEPYQDLTSK